MITNWWCHTYCDGRQCKIITSTLGIDEKAPSVCLFNIETNPNWKRQPTAICLGVEKIKEFKQVTGIDPELVVRGLRD